MCKCVVLPNDRDEGIILEGLACLSTHSLLTSENLKKGQGIQVALDIFFSKLLHKSFMKKRFSPFFMACLELHKNLSVRA